MSKEFKTAEEIYRERLEGKLIFPHDIIISSMEEYASQFKNEVCLEIEESEGEFIATLKGMKGLVVSAQTKEQAIEEMLTSLRVKFYHDNNLKPKPVDVERLKIDFKHKLEKWLVDDKEGNADDIFNMLLPHLTKEYRITFNDAVRFSEWCNSNCVMFSDGKWQMGKDFKTRYTTEELYQEFLKK